MNECRLFLDSHPDDFNTAQPRHLVQFLNDEVAEFVPSIVRVECLNRLQELCEAEVTVDLQTVEDLLHDELYHAFEFGGGGDGGGGGGGGGGGSKESLTQSHGPQHDATSNLNLRTHFMMTDGWVPLMWDLRFHRAGKEHSQVSSYK